jgi:hypothetical protein
VKVLIARLALVLAIFAGFAAPAIAGQAYFIIGSNNQIVAGPYDTFNECSMVRNDFSRDGGYYTCQVRYF